MQNIKEHAVVSTEEFIQLLVKSFQSYVDNDIIYKHPSVFVQGQPGI